MPLQDLLDSLLDSVAVDPAGVKIGAVRQVYVDDGSGKVTFAAVATGIFSADAIVPLHGARLLERELHVDHSRQSIRESPRLDDTEDGLTPDQEAELLEHYRVEAPTKDAAGADDTTTRGTTAETPTDTAPTSAASATPPPAGTASPIATPAAPTSGDAATPAPRTGSRGATRTGSTAMTFPTRTR